MEFKGTSGPWIMGGISGRLITTEDNVIIADVDTKSNAKLIAAAPDLLEALQLIRDTYTDGQISEQHIKVINEAINKALQP